MPSLKARFSLGGEIMVSCKKKGWMSGLKSVVRKMDGDEFNLFLAQVVMTASSKQIMGADLTEQIEALKELRK